MRHTARAITIALVAAACLAAGCPRAANPPANPAPAPAPVAIAPATFTVQQRSTTAIPGSDGRLLPTIDDITRGQAMVSLATADGVVPLPQRSMSAGDSVGFGYESVAYTLTMDRMDNQLVGTDAATFTLARGTAPTQSEAAPPRSEDEKIEMLIGHVAGLEGAVFIRNGQEHAAAEAADHLRMKWRRAGGLDSASAFIDAVATRSSLSGEAYHIRLADGREVESGPYLRERLADLEGDGPG